MYITLYVYNYNVIILLCSPSCHSHIPSYFSDATTALLIVFLLFVIPSEVCCCSSELINNTALFLPLLIIIVYIIWAYRIKINDTYKEEIL